MKLNEFPMQMNGSLSKKTIFAMYLLAGLGCCLIVFAVVKVTQKYTRPEPVAQTKVETRYKNLAEVRTTADATLNTYGWVGSPTNGFVRLPIQQAMEITVAEGKNPAAARSNLIAKAEKFYFKPPPPPAAPNKYE
jgi:hypothetical protein